MKKNIIVQIAAMGMAAFIAFTPVDASAATLLKRGAEGAKVTTVQTTLKKLGYYKYSKITGYYGSITVSAVKNFQKAKGLYPDGIVGTKTMNMLLGEAKSITIKSTPSVMKASVRTVTVNEQKSGALDWFSKVQYIWKRGMNATVTDIETGKSFEVKRTYGTNHADVEPLTKADTGVIKDIWNGFNWQRRAVTVQVGDYILAGSMTGMPHAGVETAPANSYVRNRSDGYGSGENLDAVKNNGVSGVLDIHFLNSKTHTTGVVQKSQQDMVKKAAKYIAKIVVDQNSDNTQTADGSNETNEDAQGDNA